MARKAKQTKQTKLTKQPNSRRPGIGTSGKTGLQIGSRISSSSQKAGSLGGGRIGRPDEELEWLGGIYSI